MSGRYSNGAPPADRPVDELTPEEVDRLRLALLRIVRSIRTNSVGDVTPSQVAILSTLIRHGPSTVGQIAEYERVKPPSVSRIVTALEERGLVERTQDPTDRRSATIALSAAGEAYVAVVQKGERQWLADRIARLPDADVECLRRSISTLEQLLA
jgi:DNA-binding MarR family transcriptional regulator